MLDLRIFAIHEGIERINVAPLLNGSVEKHTRSRTCPYSPKYPTLWCAPETHSMLSVIDLKKKDRTDIHIKNILNTYIWRLHFILVYAVMCASSFLVAERPHGQRGYARISDVREIKILIPVI